jgi:hypothetical protein
MKMVFTPPEKEDASESWKTFPIRKVKQQQLLPEGSIDF